MGSLTKVYSQEKLLGQIYTPAFIVNKILDDIGFKSKKVLKKSILDPACGDGRFLEEVVNRIIKLSSKEDLEDNLKQVHGWDIDEGAINLCIENLDKIIEKYGLKIKWNIQKIDWNIKADDSLKKLQNKDVVNFDYIVGNPPYIRIQHLENDQRMHIQKNYHFCQSGSTDIYIAFFELCYYLLSKDGVCGLITPNSYFFTETAKLMRQHFADLQSIVQITNYGDKQVFDNATTYSAITIFNRKINEKFKYEFADSLQTFKKRDIKNQEIQNRKIWQLTLNPDKTATKGIDWVELKDVCSIHVGISTLADKVFIMPIVHRSKNISTLKSRLKGEVKIETALLKPIIKGSTFKEADKDNIKECVLFPYEKQNGKYKIISESDLKSRFPKGYAYLKSVKDNLDKRDNGKGNSIAWYAFGRQQSIDNGFGEKIIFSPMSKEPNFIFSDNADATLYSGYYIKYNGDYKRLLDQLNSKRMAEYIDVSSRSFRGGWKAYNKKVLENFLVEKSKLR